jgi:hypothetical protein
VFSAPSGIGHGDPRTEEDLVVVALAQRVDNFGNVEALAQEADAAVDFAQAALAVDVVAVFRAVAVGSSPGHHLDHLGPLALDQFFEFALEPGMAGGRDVVARSGRKLQRRLDFLVIVAVALPDERLVHQ